MTIVSHRYRMVFVRTRKTAGSSVEAALTDLLGPRDWVSTVPAVEPLRRAPWTTPNRTTWPIPVERELKRRLAPVLPFPALRLRQHMAAVELRAVIGRERWDGYTKFAIERDPWDRMLSLWRWRTRSRPCSLDDYLDMIDTGDDRGHARYRVGAWSNWPLYAIDDEVSVDRVIRFERLHEDLPLLLGELGVTEAITLPRLKAGHRHATDQVSELSPDQIERIATMHAREIEAFDFVRPSAGGAGH